MSVQAIAIDWSGDARHSGKKIWRAVAHDGVVMELEGGLDREHTIDWLIDEQSRGPLVAGIDFAFSFPEWFCRAHGCATIDEVWNLARTHGETWLAEQPDPFWGKKKKGRPMRGADQPEHRATEAAGGKSVFMISNPGAVGTGSIRGMPLLAKLRSAGFSIWPFDSPSNATVVEIYPKALYAPEGVTKTDSYARREYMNTHHREHMSDVLLERSVSTDDAFDAAVSAIAMSQCIDQFASLKEHSNGSLEGAIWRPDKRTVGRLTA